MKATYRISNHVAELTIRIRMTGEFDAQVMKGFSEEVRRVGKEYAGRKHLMLADMRGTAPIAPEIAEVFGETIAWSRHNGVVLCAHLSDDTVQRLQAARLGRMSSPHDDLTVDVVSVEEGERVLAEARVALREELYADLDRSIGR